jgi:AraC family transcriptional regulator
MPAFTLLFAPIWTKVCGNAVQSMRAETQVTEANQPDCSTHPSNGWPAGSSGAKHAWQRYADFYRESSYASFPQQHRGLAGPMSFRMIEVEQRDHDFTDPDLPETILALPLASARGNRWCWDMGDGWRHDTATPGRLLLLPSGVASRWQVTGARTLLLLALPEHTMHAALGTERPDQLSQLLRPLAERAWADPLVVQLMERLWHASLGAYATDRLLADGALITLAAHLTQRAGAQEAPEQRVALPAWRLKRVTDFVEAHLHEDLGIVALADAAGLSPRHFARAFREQVGDTPHHWLMMRRIEKAKERLACSDDTLEQIAQACGFSAHSHFTRVFRLATGEPPRRWQQAHRR